MPVFSRFLRYFMAVGKYGSIRKAAEELHVSPSAVNRQILLAEEEFGVPLFDRLPNGLRLSAAGEILMAAGGDWQKAMEGVLTQFDDLSGLRQGTVQIAVIDALARGHIPRTASTIAADHPGLTITAQVLRNFQIGEAIASGKADFGIYLEPESYRDLVVRANAHVVLGFVVRPDHDLAPQTHARFAASVGQKMVVPAPPLALCQQVDVLSGATGIALDIAAASDNIQMIKSLVVDGAGMGILSSLDVVEEVREGTLSFVAISDKILRPLTLGLCVSANRTLSSAAVRVLAAVENSFSELNYDPDRMVFGFARD